MSPTHLILWTTLRGVVTERVLDASLRKCSATTD
jgi:hypothetical protein